MQNITIEACNIVLQPLINKIAFLLLFRPVTPVTGVTPRNKRNMLQHIDPSAVFLRKILIFLNPKIGILFLALLFLCSNNVLSQNAVTDVTDDVTKPKTQKVGGINLTIFGAKDLPNFEKAIDIFDCANGSFNYEPISFPFSTRDDTGRIIYDHLKYLPKGKFKVEMYLKLDGVLLRNNICKNWAQLEFQKDGGLIVFLPYSTDYFFIITSQEDSSCEVTIWFQGASIPIGKGAFYNCFH